MSNSEKWLPLFNAAKLGDEEAIKSLLAKEEVDIKTQISGETALHVAVHNGREEAVKLLCKNQELLYMKDEKGHTPLFLAILKGQVQMVEILCVNGSTINDKDKEKNTPLLVAITNNHPEIVKILLKYGAIPTVNYRYIKISPFQVALEKNFKRIVQILQNSINLIDICSCPSYPDPEFAEEIFNRCLEKRHASHYLSGKKKRNCKTVLHFAASLGREYQVKRMIGLGAKVDAQSSSDQRTPLHEAVITRQISIVEYLLTKMANVNASDYGSCTPLHYASFRDKACPLDLKQKDFEDSLKIMEILLKNGASVHVFDVNAKTPLHYAVSEEEFRPEKVRLLLEHGANVNASHLGDRTPIFFAKCPAILYMLIDKGANVNFQMLKGSFRTPLHLAIQENDATKVNILLEKGADVTVPVQHFVFNQSQQGQQSIVEILQTDPDINEAVIDRMMDISPAMKMLRRNNRHDEKNIIPILAKIQFKGDVTNSFKKFTVASDKFFSMFKKCREELQKIEDLKVLNLNLFDILIMPIKKLRSYAAKEEILKLFESGSIQEKFPVYSDTILRHFKKAKEERELIDSSSETLKKYVFSLHKLHLPDLVVYEIIDMLHPTDLKYLTEV